MPLFPAPGYMEPENNIATCSFPGTVISEHYAPTLQFYLDETSLRLLPSGPS